MSSKIKQIATYPPDKEIQNYMFSTNAVLGKGAYGTVYLAFHKFNKIPFALKVIDKKSINNHQSCQVV